MLHYMPYYGLSPDGDEGLWHVFGGIANARAFASTQNNCFHLDSNSLAAVGGWAQYP
jgi:hypothetical protein